MRDLKSIPLKVLHDQSVVSLVPELAYLLRVPRHVSSVQLDDETYAAITGAYEERKRQRYFDTTLTNISIVPTGYCEGGCRYCYAKDGWKLKDYITPQVLEASLKRQGITKVDSVIIYGGEPVTNWDAYAKLVSYLIFDLGVTSVSTSTSTFYDEETFQKLLDFVDRVDQRLSFSVSIDPEGENGDYMRRYAGKDTYRFIFERLVRLVERTPYVGSRQTLSRVSPDPFRLSRQLLDATGKHVSTTLDYVKYDEKMALTDEQHQKVLRDVTEYVQEWYYSGKANVQPWRMFSPFRKPIENKHLFSVMKGCDMGTARVSIMPDGNIADCTEDVKLGHPERYTKTDDTYRRSLGFPKACAPCDYKYMCNVQCFQYLSDVEEHSRAQRLYCEFHQHCAIEGVKFWFSRMSDEEALQRVRDQGLSGVATAHG